MTLLALKMPLLLHLLWVPTAPHHQNDAGACLRVVSLVIGLLAVTSPAPFEVLASRARRNVSCATLDQPALQKDR
jgi:hypothetical protein